MKQKDMRQKDMGQQDMGMVCLGDAAARSKVPNKTSGRARLHQSYYELRGRPPRVIAGAAS